MLTNSFIHIQSIGPITEQRFWESGLINWDSFSGDLPIPISAGRKYFLEKGIEESKKHLDSHNPAYFPSFSHQINVGDYFPISESHLFTYTLKPLGWIAISTI
jgi:hypothetical protein